MKLTTSMPARLEGLTNNLSRSTRGVFEYKSTWFALGFATAALAAAYASAIWPFPS